MEQIFEKLDRYFCKKWQLAVLDMKTGRWIVEPKVSNISYLKAENANKRHILLQPLACIAPYYLLVDDIGWNLICRQHRYPDGSFKPGRMAVETSKNNYQLWIHSIRPLSLDKKRHWLKKLHSDPGADPNNRWGRCPGFRNTKDKYRDCMGHYPLSKLVWVDWKRKADIPVIKSDSKKPMNRFSHQPRGEVCRLKKISRSDYQCADESVTDFSYAMALFRRGYSCQFVTDAIMSERHNWKNHTGEKRMNNYLQRTIKRAQRIVMQT